MSSSVYQTTVPTATNGAMFAPGYYTPVAGTTVTTTMAPSSGHPLDGAKQVANVEPKGSSSYKLIGIIVGIVIIIIILFLLFTYLMGWGRGKTIGAACNKLGDPACSGGTACSGNKTCEPSSTLGGDNASCTTSADCLYGLNCQQATNGNGTTPSGKYVCTPTNTIQNISTNRTPALVPHTVQSESNTVRTTAPTPVTNNSSSSSGNSCCCSWSPHTCPVHKRQGHHQGGNRYGYW